MLPLYECGFRSAELVLLWHLAPGPVSFVSFESPSETEMTLRWEAPEKPNGELTGYLLQYYESASTQAYLFQLDLHLDSFETELR